MKPIGIRILGRNMRLFRLRKVATADGERDMRENRRTDEMTDKTMRRLVKPLRTTSHTSRPEFLITVKAYGQSPLVTIGKLFERS